MEVGHFEGSPDFDDFARCYPAWPIIGPLVAGCFGEDFDFNGTSYLPDWPDGTTANATSVRLRSSRGQGIGPLNASKDARGNDIYVNPFATIQFETGVPASDPTCLDPTTCVVPPVGAAFYPFFALRFGEVGDAERCALLFGWVRDSTILAGSHNTARPTSPDSSLSSYPRSSLTSVFRRSTNNAMRARSSG